MDGTLSLMSLILVGCGIPGFENRNLESRLKGLKMRFQFVLINVTVLAVSYLFADDNLQESTAVKQVQLLGGKVTRDETLPGNPVAKVVSNGHFKDEDVKLLKEFRHLTALSLDHSSFVTSAGLRELSSLKNLTWLDLSFIQVTDEDLKNLSGLTNLKSLFLVNSNISEFGLKELKDLKNLTILDVSSYMAPTSRITDASLKELIGLKRLAVLKLMNIRITDAGVKELRNLTELTTLEVHCGDITDAGLKELGELKNLTTLHLFNLDSSRNCQNRRIS